MIKYEGEETKYNYNLSDVESILKYLSDNNYYNPKLCTKEVMQDLMTYIDNFLSNITESKHKTLLERRETEEEAREYFGDEFIRQFNSIMTELDKQETVVAIHGTHPEVAKKICESGLQYKLPSISGTAVTQTMNYGEGDINYQDYEGLLNWGHKNYKGLVLVAIPYECYYKEPLWNHFQDAKMGAYGVADYRIDSDFIYGYIDVNEKKIHLNPKYSRNHNYTDNYTNDNEIFRENPNLTNEECRKLFLETKNMFSNEKEPVAFIDENEEEEEIDDDRIYYETSNISEELTGLFNSIKMTDDLTDERYKYILKSLSYNLGKIKKVIPKLKDKATALKEIEEENKKFSMFDDNSSTNDIVNDDFFEFDAGDWDGEWEEEEEESIKHR